MWHAILPRGGAISGRSGNALYDEARRQQVPPSDLRDVHEQGGRAGVALAAPAPRGLPGDAAPALGAPRGGSPRWAG